MIFQRSAWKLLMQAALLTVCCHATMAQNAYLRPDDRIICSGDSITSPGTFEKYVQDTLHVLYPDAGITLINVGSGGADAASGWSAISRYRELPAPTLALFMFGIADTGWRPDNPDAKIATFVAALKKAAASAKEKQLTLIFLRETHFSHGANPAPDAFELKVTGMLDKLQQAQADFAAEQQIPMIDVRAAYQRAQARAWAKDPAYEFTPDIVHPTPPGHVAMSCEMLRAFGAGLPLTQPGAPRGAMHVEPTKDLTLSIADAVNIIKPDGAIPLTITVANQSDQEDQGQLLVVVAGQKFDKAIKLPARGTATANFTLPAATLPGRYDITPVYMAFISKTRFAADGGLFHYSRIQPSARTPLELSAASFLTLHPEKPARTCPVTDIRVQRAGDLCTIDFTWNDTTPVLAQPDAKDATGQVIPTPLSLGARDGQACDAVECLLDLRPIESIGRWTSGADANPPGVLRVGIYQELVEGHPIAKLIATPAQPPGAVTLTDLGQHRYRLTLRAKPAAPCAGFSMRITDNTIYKTASTQLFLLPGYPQYQGKDPLTFVQLGEQEDGILYRFGY